MTRTAVTTESAAALATACPRFRDDARAALEPEVRARHDHALHPGHPQTVFPDVARTAAEDTCDARTRHVVAV